MLGRSGGWFRLSSEKRRVSRLLVRAGVGVGYGPNGAQMRRLGHTFRPDGLCIGDEESQGGGPRGFRGGGDM